MKVVISGGTGLIGRALTSSFSADGAEVVVLTRTPDAHPETGAAARYVEWDGRTPGPWTAELEDATAVVNLAGFNLVGNSPFTMRWTERRKRLILDSRRAAGETLVSAIRAAGRAPQVFVQASAIGYYGPRGNEPIAETEPPGDDFLAHVCKVWEASSVEVEALGVRRVVIRTGIVLEHGNLAFDMLNLPIRLFVGGPIGWGRQVLSWIHITDHIRAIRFLIDNKPSRGVYNLSAPNPVTNGEYGRTAARILRRPYYFPVPGFMLRLALGEVSTVVLDGQRVIPARLLADGFSFTYPDLEPALRDLMT